MNGAERSSVEEDFPGGGEAPADTSVTSLMATPNVLGRVKCRVESRIEKAQAHP